MFFNLFCFSLLLFWDDSLSILACCVLTVASREVILLPCCVCEACTVLNSAIISLTIGFIAFITTILNSFEAKRSLRSCLLSYCSGSVGCHVSLAGQQAARRRPFCLFMLLLCFLQLIADDALHLHLHKYCEGFHITRRNDVTSGAFQTWVLVGVHILTVYPGFEATLGGCLLWWSIDYDWQLLSTSAAKTGSVLLVFRDYNFDSMCVYWFPDGNLKTVSTLCHDARFWK